MFIIDGLFLVFILSAHIYAAHDKIKGAYICVMGSLIFGILSFLINIFGI